MDDPEQPLALQLIDEILGEIDDKFGNFLVTEIMRYAGSWEIWLQVQLYGRLIDFSADTNRGIRREDILREAQIYRKSEEAVDLLLFGNDTNKSAAIELKARGYSTDKAGRKPVYDDMEKLSYKRVAAFQRSRAYFFYVTSVERALTLPQRDNNPHHDLQVLSRINIHKDRLELSYHKATYQRLVLHILEAKHMEKEAYLNAISPRSRQHIPREAKTAAQAARDAAIRPHNTLKRSRIPLAITGQGVS